MNTPDIPRPHLLVSSLLRSALLLASLFIVVSVSPLHAQSGMDVLLSEPIPEQQLTSDIRIEAAAELGTTRLVVWGTFVEGSNGRGANALVFDAGNGQQILHSPDAVPYGNVAIAVLADRFLVLWNDRRPNNPGIYGRTIMPDGSFGRPEFLFDPMGYLRGVIYWQNHGSGSTLLWNDTRNNTIDVYLQRIDKEGSPRGNTESLGQGAIVEMYGQMWPDGRLILQRQNAPPITIGANGEPEKREVPVGRLNKRYDLGIDGSLVTLDSNWFSYYEDMYAPEPLWERRLERNHEKDIYYNAATIRRRGDTFVVTWPTFYTDYPLRTIETESSFFTSAHDSVLTRWDSVFYWISNGGSFGVSRAEYTEECQGLSRIKLYATYHQLYNPDPAEVHPLYWVDSSGNILHREKATPNWISEVCDQPSHDVVVSRLNSDGVSRVRVTWSNGVHSSHTAQIGGKNYDVNSPPVMTLSNGSVTVGWYQLGNSRLGEVTFKNFPDKIERYSSVIPTEMKHEANEHWPIEGFGRGGLLSRVSYFEGLSGVNNNNDKIPGNRHKYFYVGLNLHLLQGEGWNRVKLYEETVSVSLNSIGHVRVYRHGYDPDTDVYAFAYDRYSMPGRRYWYSIVAAHGDMSIQQEIVPPWEISHVIPINRNSVLLINSDNHGRIVNTDGMSLYDIVWPSSPLFKPVRYWKLHGSSILRESRQEGTNLRRLDLLSIEGKQLDSVVLRNIPDSTDLFVTQNPNDKSIVLLYGSPEGVLLTHLTKNLLILADQNRLQHNVRINSEEEVAFAPVGVVRNDSLLFAWLDEQQQVYANKLALTKASQGGGEDSRIILSTLVYPNPVSNTTVMLSLPLVLDNLIVECIDPVGRAIPIPILEHLDDALLLDISELGNHSYFVRVRSEGYQLLARLIVLR